MPIIPELKRWKQEDQNFEFIFSSIKELSCMRPYIKTNKQNKIKQTLFKPTIYSRVRSIRNLTRTTSETMSEFTLIKQQCPSLLGHRGFTGVQHWSWASPEHIWLTFHILLWFFLLYTQTWLRRKKLTF